MLFLWSFQKLLVTLHDNSCVRRNRTHARYILRTKEERSGQREIDKDKMQTPIYHIPALLAETIEGLNVQATGTYVDVTFGGGGHSRAILAALTQAAGNAGLYSSAPVEAETGVKPHDGGEEMTSTATGGNEQEVVEDAGTAMGRLYSFDQDADALQNALERDATIAAETRVDERIKTAKKKAKAEHGEDICITKDNRWTFVHSNFRYLKNWMDYYGEEGVDGVLADLGVSFHHFDSAERGFSFRFKGPLDMRMNQQAKKTAADVINDYTEEELSQVLYLYGELKNARQIAKTIVRARQNERIERTEQLVEILVGKKQMTEADGMTDITNPKAKKEMVLLFQALRMEVNDEIQVLREMLTAARDLLRPGGRFVVLTYHSLEDRLVKNFFRSGNLQGEIEKDFYGNVLSPFRLINKNVIVASEEEVARNPRSRSAKLRIAEKI